MQLTPPTIDAPVPDDVALWQALANQHHLQPGTIDFCVLQTLSQQLRDLNWRARIAVRENEIVAISSPSTRWLGLAVDIGTTKIAGYLVDLESGKTLASQGLMNPQISYGKDVVSRIVATRRSQSESERLQKLLVDALSQMATELCAQVIANPTDVVDVVVVGNTAIHHLFLRLPVEQLGLAPYVPAVHAAFDVKARDIGLRIASGAYVHLLPNIAGYVGADHVAMLLATRIADSNGAVWLSTSERIPKFV